jgi:ABC-type polysaccharide/polyol phosphate transport system ATPase subunit
MAPGAAPVAPPGARLTERPGRARRYRTPGMNAAEPPALVVDGVVKRFRIPGERVLTLKERALHPLRKVPWHELTAVDGVSFTVAPGEFFAVVGRNGSGKSTLLKCMAGIYAVDRGEMFVNGRVSTFIELGVGFNMELPARENVIINAAMLGLPPRDARRRLDRVLEFAELEEFADLRLKNYSSGMLVRLAFAVMIQVDADILLIDEVLAVGDASFQQKCYDEFARLRRQGRTVILVTHDMGAVERFCDRALLLEHGCPVMIGDPHAVGLRYLDLNFARETGEPERDDADEEEEQEQDRFGDGRAEILEAWFENADGRRAGALPGGQRCSFVARARFREEVDDPIIGLALQNAEQQTVLAASTLAMDPRLGTFRAGEEVTIRIAFENVFRPDRYYATPAIAHAGTGFAWLDRRERFTEVVVTGTSRTDAIVDLPYEVALDRSGTPRRRTEVAG